jgi:hypothetical protein
MSQQDDAKDEAIRYYEIAARIRDMFPDDSDEEIEAKVERYLGQNP